MNSFKCRTVKSRTVINDSSSRALQFKSLGNEAFHEGRFSRAAEYYTSALLQDEAAVPAAWVNRAQARIKLGDWDGAESDCR